MRTRSDCFKMRIIQRRKTTCLSLTRNPRWSFLERICIHLLTLARLLALSSLSLSLSLSFSLSREPERTRCFPSHVMHLHCRTAVMLCLYCPLCRSQTICFWHNSFRLSWRAKDFTFHCKGLLIRVYPSPQYWETRPQEIPSEHEHTTAIQQSD